MLRCAKLVVATSFIALTGCSFFYGERGIIQNRDNDYLKAKTSAPLQIPPGLSSSTIEAHYPVSERDYPESLKKVDLIPPDLHQPVAATPVTPVTQSMATAPMVAQAHGRVAPANQGAVTAAGQEPFAPKTYYDPYTRTTSNQAAGMPIGDALRSIWPWGNKKNTASAQQPPAKPSFWSSLWTVNSTQVAAAPATATTNPQQKTADATQNNAGAEAPQKSTMPSMYYDRYTHR